MSEERISLSQQQPQQNAPVVPQDFVVPTDLVPLPSEGKVYPTDSPLFNKKTIEVRSMTAKEEDILTSRALLRGGKAISMLLRSCVVDKTVDVDKMLVGDRNAALIGIRITGYGPEYNTSITCPACGEEVKREIDLRELPVKRFPENARPIREGANEFEFTLPKLCKRVVFKLMTGDDERELLAYAENSRKVGIVEELITTRHKLMIISIGGESDKSKLATMIKNMPAADSRAFRKHVDELTPGVELTVDFSCGACGTESKGVEVPLGTEFFWPKA